MSALDAAKDAVQTAENLIHRKGAEGFGPGSPLTLRDGMILVTALVKVMEVIEVNS
ncbi:hypothetical protein [Mycolicibacterium fortuitum]|uniref:hypothetical protein n=1 Tax=Mycolicibacterium fortuitum TaxID=1766 RepID=UPI000A4AA2E4|nr:hypothetical protein [Mycolicibacterium fortuitum]NOQ62823.1 hypothetical protein [Mycolicibacterium fortuitum]